MFSPANLQVQRELKSKLEFQAKANEEAAALQKEIDEQEKQLADLKRRFSSINALLNEIKQLKAVQQQMIHETQKTYAELKQEFEGMWSSQVVSLQVFMQRRSLGAESDEELMSLAASFNEELETRRQAEAALESKLTKLNRGKEQHEAALFTINEQLSSLRAALEVIFIHELSSVGAKWRSLRRGEERSWRRGTD